MRSHTDLTPGSDNVLSTVRARRCPSSLFWMSWITPLKAGGNGTREGQGLGPRPWVPLKEGWEPASPYPPMLSALPGGGWVPRWADGLGHVPGVGWASCSCSAGVATRRPPLQAVS